MKKRLLALLLVLCLCFGSFSVYADEVEDSRQEELTEEEQEQLNELMYKYYQSVMRLIVEAYCNGEITEEELYGAFIQQVIGTDPEMVEAAIRAAATLLDDSSYFMNREEFEEYYEHLDSHYCGIGVVVTTMNGPLTITGFSADKTPAKTAGILPGDIILTVDGTDISGKTTDEIGDLIRGEKGTVVKLGIKRNNESLTIDVIRDEVEQNLVSYKVTGDRIYIKLTSFNEGCSEKIAEALEYADDRKIKKVILDFRDNTGGIGTEAFATASLFLPKDSLITTIKYNDSSMDEVHKSTASFLNKKYTTVVLVNEYSASCSEMVAGALQDHGMGYLIGVNTYGKSTGQRVFPIDPLEGYLKLTISKYYTPSGQPIPEDGIIPDKYVANRTIPLNESDEFEKLTFARKPKLGDYGSDVLACKQRLNILGYYVGDLKNDRFDKLLEDVVKKFQSDFGLYSYGVLDNATMLKLYNLTNNVKVEIDTQLEAAEEYLDRN